MSEFSAEDRQMIKATHDAITGLMPVIQRQGADINAHDEDIRNLDRRQAVQEQKIETIEGDVVENKENIGNAFKAIGRVKTLVAEISVKRMGIIVTGGTAIIVAIIQYFQ